MTSQEEGGLMYFFLWKKTDVCIWNMFPFPKWELHCINIILKKTKTKEKHLYQNVDLTQITKDTNAY